MVIRSKLLRLTALIRRLAVVVNMVTANCIGLVPERAVLQVILGAGGGAFSIDGTLVQTQHR